MVTKTNIRIGGGGRWADQDDLPRPEKKTPPPEVQTATVEALPDDTLQDLPNPRTYQQILDARSSTAPAVQKPEVVQTGMLYIILAAITSLVALSALSVLLYNISVATGNSPAAPSTMATSSVLVDSGVSTQSQLAATDAPAGIVVGAVGNKGRPDEYTVVAVGKYGGLLVKQLDGSYGLGRADPSSTCVPTYWSPPQTWGVATMTQKFESEQTTCFDLQGKPMSMLGYWGDSNWVFFLRPKAANPDDNKPEDWDRVWADVTWYGGTMAQVKAIAGVKDFQQSASAPPPPPTQQPPAGNTGNGYVPPAATPVPPCTPDRYNAVVSDINGTYYSCDGDVNALLAAHPGSVVGDAAEVQARQAALNAEVAKRNQEIAQYQTQQAVDQARRDAAQSATQQAVDAAARAAQEAQAQRAAAQATADAIALLNAAHAALQAQITPTQGPVKCYECH